MNPHFYSKLSPSREEISELEEISPYSLFNSCNYAEACTKIKEIPCLFALKDDEKIIGGCLGFLSKAGFLWCKLMIYSAPNISHHDIFWDGIKNFCKKQGVWDLTIENLFTDVNNVPDLPDKVEHKSGFQFSIDLNSSDLFKNFSKSHRYRINKAKKAGLSVLKKDDFDSCLIHLELRKKSMERRKNRGEDVNIPSDIEYYKSLLESKAGELFQVTDGKSILSSGLVGKFKSCAYWHASGTSPEGMDLGAAYLNRIEVIKILKEEEISIFNWGATFPDNPGLMQFKAGFGARKEPLDIVTFSMKNPILRKFRTAVQLLRQDPKSFFASLITIKRWFVYTMKTKNSSYPVELTDNSDITIRQLTDDELIRLSDSTDIGFQRIYRKFRNIGSNSGYGIFVKGELAGVGWLNDYNLDKKGTDRKLNLSYDEAELTHGYTAEKYRGRGFQGLRISHLAYIANTKGIEKVFTVVKVKNFSAQRGNTKAGMTKYGQTWRVIFLSFFTESLYINIRWYRWRSFCEFIKRKFVKPPSA